MVPFSRLLVWVKLTSDLWREDISREEGGDRNRRRFTARSCRDLWSRYPDMWASTARTFSFKDVADEGHGPPGWVWGVWGLRHLPLWL